MLNKQLERTALIDMDGTLCNFDKAMTAGMAALAGPEEKHQNMPREDRPPHIEARWDLVKRQPGFWENLEKYQPGFDLLETFQELGFSPHILTKGPVETDAAWSEKLRWCKRYLPGVPVTVSMDKGLVYGKVLADDWPPYIFRWLEWRPRGLVVIPAHPWNEGINHPNCVRYDGTNMNEIRARLEDIK